MTSKYRNKKTTVNGIAFDSQKEAARFQELLLMQEAGEITGLRLQPEFTLQEAFTTLQGERVRAVKYRADFSLSAAAKGGRGHIPGACGGGREGIPDKGL